MKKQISNRLGLAHVRDTIQQFALEKITYVQAMQDLGVGKTRLYELRSDYLRARSMGNEKEWHPGVSGGNHKASWPDSVHQFLRTVLGSKMNGKAYSYAFAASEIGRIFQLHVDRGQIRHWAIENGLAKPASKPRPPAHVRRWQRSSIGELWQLDATPDPFLGESVGILHLLDMIDDSSRLQVGARLYKRECIEAYMDFFYTAFTRYGLPLEIYVDKASFFRNINGDLTQLATRLKFYEVSFVFANSPEAKGKIERVHIVWQNRLPSYFQHEDPNHQFSLEEANMHLQSLVDYRNQFELHREIGTTPQNAWYKAKKELRNKLRAIPEDGWWEFVWSFWSRTTVGSRGRVYLEDKFFPTECKPGTKVWLYQHLNGTHSVLKNLPTHESGPVILFTNNPNVRKIEG